MDLWDHISLHPEIRKHSFKWKLLLRTLITHESRYSSVDGKIACACSQDLSIRLIAKDAVCVFELALVGPKFGHASEVRRPTEIGCVVL
jgi:hypothetical protein